MINNQYKGFSYKITPGPFLAGFVLSVLFIFVISGCGKRVTPPPPLKPPAPVKKTATPMGFTIQAGAFKNVDNAARLTASLERKGLPAYYFRHESGLFKVRFGDYRSREKARARAAALVSQSVIDVFYIVGPEDYALARLRTSGADGLRKEIVKTAQNFLGLPYKWGGSSPEKGFDCSGLTMAVYQLNGISLPRTSRDQFSAGSYVRKKELAKGDLVFFKTKSRVKVSHVGVYIGDGKFIHAPNKGKTIRRDLLSNSYYAMRYVGGRSYI